MSLLSNRLKSSGTNRRGSVAAVTWDSAKLYFATADVKGTEVVIRTRETLELVDAGAPLSQLRHHLDQSAQTVDRVLLLLPRSSLEMTSVSVPKVDDDELPALIQAEVDQLLGDGESELIVDYFQLASTDSNSQLTPASETGNEAAGADATVRAVACSMRADQLERWRGQAEQAKLRPLAIAPRQLGPLPVLQSLGLHSSPVTVLLVIYSNEVEVAFYRRSELLFLRTIRTRTTDVDSLADQIQTEVRRTISLANLNSGTVDLRVVMHVVEGAEAAEGSTIQEALADSLAVEVRYLVSASGASTTGADPIFSGAIGAWVKQQTAIDMLSPKQSPKPPNPYIRWAGLGTLAAGAMAVASYFLLADVATLRDEVRQLQEEVAEGKKVAAKLQEKADETRVVQAWLGDSVDWLGQLKILSDQFPDGQSASVSRLSASALEDGSQIDLSVQVNDQELVSGLETRLRTSGFAVTSKQVSEQSGSDYPWRFEARIRFPNTPLDEREEVEQFVSTGTNQPAVEDQK